MPYMGRQVCGLGQWDSLNRTRDRYLDLIRQREIQQGLPVTPAVTDTPTLPPPPPTPLEEVGLIQNVVKNLNLAKQGVPGSSESLYTALATARARVAQSRVQAAVNNTYNGQKAGTVPSLTPGASTSPTEVTQALTTQKAGLIPGMDNQTLVWAVLAVGAVFIAKDLFGKKGRRR